MQDRTYALAFLIILVVVCLGAYLAATAIIFGLGGSIIPWGKPTPTIFIQNPSPTLAVLPAESPSPFPHPSTPTAPSPTPFPPSTQTPSPEASPFPTSTPMQGIYSYKLLSLDRPCGQSNTYIRGTVRDKAGNGIAGVRLHLYSTWGYDEIRETKGDIDAGNYDFVMGFDPGIYRIEVINNSGIPLSLAQTVEYTPGCTNYVNWEKVQ